MPDSRRRIIFENFTLYVGAGVLEHFAAACLDGQRFAG